MNIHSTRFVQISFQNTKNFKIIHLLLDEYRDALQLHIKSILSTHSYLKFRLIVAVKPAHTSSRKLIETRNHLLIYKEQVLEKLGNAFQDIYRRFPNNSKTFFDEICYVKCEIYKIYNSPSGGMINHNLYFPPFLRSKKSCILSIALCKSMAKSCFIFSVASALKIVPPSEKPWRPRHYYDIIKTFDKSSFCDSMPIHMFSRFENANKLNLYVFTIDCEKKAVITIYYSDNSYYQRSVNLLLYNKHYFQPLSNTYF